MKQNRHQSVWLPRTIHVFIPVGLTILLFVGAIFGISLPALEKHLMASRHEMIKEITTTAWHLLSDYHQQVQSGKLTMDEAQNLAREKIRSIRYGPEHKDYLWINDMTPVMIMHPYRSDLEGKDVSDFVDPNNKRLFIEFRDKVEKDGAGFVDYMWQWKDDPDHIVPKLSYVAGFEPWGWIVGTGIYLEDVHDTIAQITKKLKYTLFIILLIIILISIYIIWHGIKVDLALEAANEELLRKTRLATLGLITGKVGHDLRNPLSTIDLTISLIENKVRDTELNMDKELQRTKRAINQSKNIISELLEYTRVGDLDLKPTDFDKWLKDVINHFQFSDDIEVIMKLNSNTTISIDQERFQRCIINIITNAIEAMNEKFGTEPGKRLVFTSNARENKLVLDIEDNGAGIPDNIKEKIFEPLFTTKAKGIGLGMTIIQQIVAQQNGEIGFDSHAGQGTKVSIILPIG